MFHVCHVRVLSLFIALLLSQFRMSCCCTPAAPVYQPDRGSNGSSRLETAATGSRPYIKNGVCVCVLVCVDVCRRIAGLFAFLPAFQYFIVKRHFRCRASLREGFWIVWRTKTKGFMVLVTSYLVSTLGSHKPSLSSWLAPLSEMR